MNDIKSFSAYDNYYKLLKLLDREERKEVSLWIFEFMFEDLEPKSFTEKQEYVWSNLLQALNTSKKNSKSSRKRAELKADEELEENQTDNQKKTKKETKTKPNGKPKGKPKQNKYIFLISNFKFLKDKRLLGEKIEEWFKYKSERKQNYTETGAKNLLARIERATNQYGADAMVSVISDSMASNYQGIVFEKLQNYAKPDDSSRNAGYAQRQLNVSPTPEWIDKKIEKEQASEEECAELEELLKEFK